ncbi:MAG: hypothetical protein AAGJ81_13035 [Verrucomicrobiota bacterium]
MNNRVNSMLLGLVAPAILAAQSSDDLNEGLVLEHIDPGGTKPYSLRWFSRLDHYYFIQQSTDLMDWSWFRYATIGDDDVAGIQFDTTADRLFFRLSFTDDTNSPPYILDADQDGISNGDELVAGPPFDIFAAETVADSEPDGLPDYWEQYHFGDLSRDGSGDYDGDGILDKYEWLARTDPTIDQSADHVFMVDQYTYDDRGWLLTHQLKDNPRTLSYDAEGNVEAAQ